MDGTNPQSAVRNPRCASIAGRPRLEDSTCLMLRRMEEQSVRIGDDVRVTVTHVDGNHVHLAVEAPPHVSVHREEVYQALQAENARPAR